MQISGLRLKGLVFWELCFPLVTYFYQNDLSLNYKIWLISKSLLSSHNGYINDS